MFVTTSVQAQNSPCYWSGQLVKCFPTTGIFLDKQRALRLGDATTNYVEIKAGSPVTTYSLTMPTAQGAASTFLQNNGSGVLSWVTNTGATVPSAGGIVYSNGTSLLSAAGTSGGIPYFSASNVPTSSGVLGANEVVIGGGAGASPSTATIAGIGTTSPAGKSVTSGNILVISGANGNGGQLSLQNTANSNIELSLFSANNGFFVDYTGQTTSTNNQLQFRTNNASGSNAVGTHTMTLSSTGNVGIGSDTPGALLDVSGAMTAATTGVAIHGTTTNNSAAAGYVGEFISDIQSSAGSSMTSGTWCVVDSANTTCATTGSTGLALTAGDWDIRGYCYVTCAGGAAVTDLECFISTSQGNNTTGRLLAENNVGMAFAVTNPSIGLSITPWRVSLSGSQTYFLKGLASFTGGSCTQQGRIDARRIR